jgi:hypothetical protein
MFENLDFEESSFLKSGKPKGWETLTEAGVKEADLSAVYAHDDKNYHSGKQSVKISKTAESKTAAWLQKAPCKGNDSRYQISAWVKTEGMPDVPIYKSGANLMVVFDRKGNDSLVYEAPMISKTQNWHQQKMVFIMPEECSEMKLVLGLHSTTGTAWWDEVSIMELPPIKLAGLKKINEEMDQYGGWKKIKGRATGYFHTEKIGNRWWIITPEGNSFIVVGLQHMFRKNKDAERIEQIKNIPTNKDNMRERFQMLTKAIPYIADTYHIAIEDLLPRSKAMEIRDLVELGNVEAVTGIDEVFQKIEKVINKSMPELQWAQTTMKKLKEWGFNTLSHKPALFKGIVYDAQVSSSLWGFPFITPEVRVRLTGVDMNNMVYAAMSFPDIFDVKFKEILDKDFKKTAAGLKDDPWLLGYFLGNELPWAGYPSKGVSLFDMFFALSSDREGKKGLVEFLKKRYGNNTKIFNKIWGADIKDFKELLTMTKLVEGVKSEQCRQDKSEFLRLVAETYFKINYETIKKYDPNHMILGVRFAGYAVPQEVLETIGKYVDIVSFQPYDPIVPLEWLEESYKLHLKPVLITEFSFKAEDSGLPNTIGAGITFKTQKDRAIWYERYVTHLLSSPVMIGQIWYKYADDPPRENRESGNYGLVTYSEEPYKELVEKVKEVNNRTYHLATQSDTEK